jgi:hypothetical protein
MKSDGQSGRRERRDTRLRFEQWARNPRCHANTLSAVHGIPMTEVAKAEGIPPTMGQSPFALARGLNFERVLFRNAGQSLRDALVRAGIVADETRGFLDFRLRINGGQIGTLEHALNETAELLNDLANARGGEGRRPAIVGGATVRLPGKVMLPEAILIIDVLAIRYESNPFTVTVGEIKTYPDRGGFTDPSDLASARAQAGVYVHGLRTVLAELGISDKLVISDKGFLVLSRPGSNQPSVRSGEDLRFQAWRAERGFNQLEEAARSLPPPGDKDPVASIRNAKTAYCQECISFCDRASLCFERAVESGDSVFLGEDVSQFLGAIPLTRALELLDGAKPLDSTEQDLVRRLGAIPE